MGKRLWVALILLLLIAAGGAGWWYLSSHPEALNQPLVELELQPAKAPEGISASGFIEAEEVSVVAELGGRIVEVLADEGDEVEEGQVLVKLDTALLEAQIAQAQAALEMAQARLAQVEAGARPEEIRKAEAELAQAKAACDGAYQAWQDALALRDNPQELEAKIDAARTELEVAEHRLKQAIANKDAAEMVKKNLESALAQLDDALSKPLPDPVRESLKEEKAKLWSQLGEATNDWWQAWVAVNAAVAARDGARAALDDLLAMRENPQELNAQVDAARSQYETAQAAVKVAEAKLDALRAGATKEQLAAARAQVRQAEANVRALEVQLEKATLRSPIAGLVTNRVAHEGELASPGAVLMTVANLDEVTLTLYIAEDKIGRVKVGQGVEVRVDSYPGEVFEGEVSYISSEAEFTPKNVQTKEERVSMVFAVKVRIGNAEHKLKPGMPADAVIKGSQEAP